MTPRQVSPEPGSVPESDIDSLRRLDPGPPSTSLAAEVAQAMTRTRTAVATARTMTLQADGPVAAYTRYPAPWGVIHLAAGAGGVVAVELRGSTEAFVERLSARLGGLVVEDQPGVATGWRSTLADATEQLDAYFAGTREAFDLAVDLRGVSAWDRLVLDGARGLAYGETTSYGRLAARIGRPRAARAVGGALGRNPIPIVIPCHRILAGDGSIGGYGGGLSGGREALLDVKRTLLRVEGVEPGAR